MATLGICFVIMLVALDQTIVGTALPTIVAELKGFDLYAWVATSYLLTSVITVPIFGRLGDFYGRKPFLIASIIIFVAVLGLVRFVQQHADVGAGARVAGDRRRHAGRHCLRLGGRSVSRCACAPALANHSQCGIWHCHVGGALARWFPDTVAGLALGVLCQFAGGRVVLVFAWRYVPHIRHVASTAKMRLDWFGAVLITLSLGSLQLLVEMLPKRGLTMAMLGLLAFTVAAFYGLWKWERHTEQPILPFEMVRDPALSSLFILSVLAGFSMFSMLMYAPLLFQGGFGMSPREAGLLITPLVACITVASIVNGRVVTRIPNPNIMMTVGFVLIALSCLGIVLSQRGTSTSFMLTAMLAGGFGLGLVLPNLTVFAQQAASREHLGIATALLQSLRMIGGMLGTAVTGTLVTHMYSSGVEKALESDHAVQWMAEFKDPEILVNHDIPVHPC